MASVRDKRTAAKDERQASVPKARGGFRKAKSQTSLRRSTRLSSKCAGRTGPLHSPSTSKTACREIRLPALPPARVKRPLEVEDPVNDDSTQSLRKRQRKSSQLPIETQPGREAPPPYTNTRTTSVSHWVENGVWPKELFGRGMMATDRFLAMKKSAPSLGRKRSGTDSISGLTVITPSDQKPRETKSKPYMNAGYQIRLATLGSFMKESELGITDGSKELCRRLLYEQQAIPQDSLFRNDLFAMTCEALQDRNEARILRDILPLLVPSAENLAIHGVTELKTLIESINEGWNNSIPLTEPRPQPDYSVGFTRDTFTKDQLEKLEPYIGDYTGDDLSLLMGTQTMYFPFLTCEATCGLMGLEIADQQNAHSMTLAVRAIVTLFRLANRQQELHRKILAFSVSHDHQIVKVYGHYPEIAGDETKYYRHLIHGALFTAPDANRWTTYQFTMNFYKTWMPIHLAGIRSAIDDIPDSQNQPLSEDSS